MADNIIIWPLKWILRANDAHAQVPGIGKAQIICYIHAVVSFVRMVRSLAEASI